MIDKITITTPKYRVGDKCIVMVETKEQRKAAESIALSLKNVAVEIIEEGVYDFIRNCIVYNVVTNDNIPYCIPEECLIPDTRLKDYICKTISQSKLEDDYGNSVIFR